MIEADGWEKTEKNKVKSIHGNLPGNQEIILEATL